MSIPEVLFQSISYREYTYLYMFVHIQYMFDIYGDRSEGPCKWILIAKTFHLMLGTLANIIVKENVVFENVSRSLI